MNKPVKTKLCWNCEGSVSRSAENCPYCAVYLSPEEVQEEKSLQSLPKAPYSLESNSKGTSIPKAPYSPKEEPAQEAVIDGKLKSSTRELKSVFLPLFLLASGFLALFFSMILLLFSVEGKLTLQWSGDTWYFYTILSLPMLFFGWKLLGSSDQE